MQLSPFSSIKHFLNKIASMSFSWQFYSLFRMYDNFFIEITWVVFWSRNNMGLENGPKQISSKKNIGLKA